METVRRGYEPRDAAEFGPQAAEKLNAAAQELARLDLPGQGLTMPRLPGAKKEGPCGPSFRLLSPPRR